MLTLFLSCVAVLIFALILLGWRRPDLLGIRDKTLWDWVALLLVPSTVGFGTAIISYTQFQMEQSRAQDVTVQQFIDRVSDLTLAGSRTPQVKVVLRAQTVAVLQMIEGAQAGQIIAFLAGLGQLRDLELEFETMDLTGATLKGLDLRGVDLEDARLSRAELERSDLRGADLEGADLRGADLKGSNFSGVSLARVRFDGADLTNAQLQGADLSQSLGLRMAQLERSCFDAETKLPNALPRPAKALGCGRGIDED